MASWIIKGRVTLEPLLRFFCALGTWVQIPLVCVLDNRGQGNTTKSAWALPGRANDERSHCQCLAL